MLHADHSNYELIKKMLPRLWAHVWRLTYDVELAEQLVHSACTFIVEQGLPLPSDKSPRLWLFWSFYRALRHVRSDDLFWRKSCDIKMHAFHQTSAEGIASAESDSKIVNAMRKLPDAQLKVFLLVNIEHFNAADVAFIMSITLREVISLYAESNLHMSRMISSQLNM